jgi:hypothetical protein
MIIVGKPGGKRPLGTPKVGAWITLKGSSKQNGMLWTPVHCRDQCRALVNIVINILVP